MTRTSVCGLTSRPRSWEYSLLRAFTSRGCPCKIKRAYTVVPSVKVCILSIYFMKLLFIVHSIYLFCEQLTVSRLIPSSIIIHDSLRKSWQPFFARKGGNAENGVYMLEACTCRCYHHIGVYVEEGTCISCANITVLMTLFKIGSLWNIRVFIHEYHSSLQQKCKQVPCRATWSNGWSCRRVVRWTYLFVSGSVNCWHALQRMFCVH